jgi:acetyl esterase/lipase
MLVVLRDQGIPLPAGGILISPWVDLTHSFPSVASGSSLDYIPEHGFMHRPSQAWPPPNADDLASIYKAAEEKKTADKTKTNSAPAKVQPADQETAVHGFTVRRGSGEKVDHTYPGLQNNLEPAQEEHIRTGKADTLVVPMQDNTVVEIKDQIQMYCPNQLLSHPLVSPILQPSLGGLPPLLILTGGGELLRDEQIYLAHKAADPAAYPPTDAYLDEHDPDRTKLNQYDPTYVQLQVWEDLCHVGITLSWTKPAKFMFRSIAQFGAWALAHAQHEEIEIPKDDTSSISSSSSSPDPEREQPKGSIGKAGDPLPRFHKHIIRQKVDRHGVVYHLEPPHALPALQQPREKVGAINSTIVSKWLVAKKAWDEKFAKPKLRVQRSRIKDFETGYYGFDDEIPPACAMASRRMEKDVAPPKPRKSYGMMLWSLAASKHDKEIAEKEGIKDEVPNTVVQVGHDQGNIDAEQAQDSLSNRNKSHSRPRSQSRIVTDSGQAADNDQDTANAVFNGPTQQQEDHGGDTPTFTNSDNTPVILIPGLDTNAGPQSLKFVDNASTRAIRNEDGVISVKDNISLRPDAFSLSSTDSVPKVSESSLIRKSFQYSEHNSAFADSVPQTPTSAAEELMSAGSSIATNAAVRHAPGILRVEKPKVQDSASQVESNSKENGVNSHRPKMPERDEFITAEEYRP